MTPREQAEQAARDWLLKSGICYKHSNGQWVAEEDEVQSLATLLLAQRAAVLEEVADTLQVGRYEYDEKTGMNIITVWPSPSSADWCRQQAKEARG